MLIAGMVFLNVHLSSILVFVEDAELITHSHGMSRVENGFCYFLKLFLQDVVGFICRSIEAEFPQFNHLPLKYGFP